MNNNVVRCLSGKKATRLFLSIVLIFIIAFLFSAGNAQAETLSSNVNYPSQEEIVLYSQENPTNLAEYTEDGKPLKNYTIGYDETPVLQAPYKAGRLSDEELICAFNTVKTIRYIAGISDEIYLSDKYNSLAQASSIVNYVNNKLTHTPSAPSDMDSALAADGITGSKNSNIAWMSWQNSCLKHTIIDGWMADSDTNNISILGHRRWILNPSMGMTGFGAVTGVKGTFNAMYANDTSNPDNAYTGVCWPAKNTPTSYFSVSSPWSISIGSKVDEKDVFIYMIRKSDRKTWAFSSLYSDGDFYVNNQNYGQTGCIIFRPSGIDEYSSGDSFNISVYIGNDVLRYDVNFFDLEHYYSTEPPVINSLKINSVGKPSLQWESVPEASSYNVYRKARGGSWKLICEGLKACTFDDASAGKGIRYYYRITTNRVVNGTNYESEYSASKYVTVPLSTPKITYLKSTAKKTNYIKWSSVSKATGYKVYRRLAGSSKWTLVKTTGNRYYKNTTAVSGKKYEYRVRAYRIFNGYTVYSSYTAKKSVKTK